MIYQNEEIYIVFKKEEDEALVWQAAFTSALEAKEYAAVFHKKYKEDSIKMRREYEAYREEVRVRLGPEPTGRGMAWDAFIQERRAHNVRRREIEQQVAAEMPKGEWLDEAEFYVEGPVLLNPNRKDWVEEPEEEQDFTEADKEWIEKIDGHTLQPHEL